MPQGGKYFNSEIPDASRLDALVAGPIFENPANMKRLHQAVRHSKRIRYSLTQPAGGSLPGWIVPQFGQVRAFSSA